MTGWRTSGGRPPFHLFFGQGEPCTWTDFSLLEEAEHAGRRHVRGRAANVFERCQEYDDIGLWSGVRMPERHHQARRQIVRV